MPFCQGGGEIILGGDGEEAFSRASRFRDAQVAADLPGHPCFDLLMARHCRSLLLRPVHIQRMPAAFAQQFAAVPFQMPDKIATFHAA